MNKKVYQEPRANTIIVQTQYIIAATTKVDATKGNAGIIYGGGGSEAALSRGGDWDDEEGE